jgi:hypothetical protein
VQKPIFKLTLAAFSLAATIMLPGCSTPTPAGEEFEKAERNASVTESWTVSEIALTWLQDQQRPDGFWGSDKNRVMLTSLALLEFLNHGEMPSSPKYGKTVQNGISALATKVPAEQKLSPQAKDLLLWCLSEAYALTKIPILQNAALQQLSNWDKHPPSQWRIFAANALQMSGIAPETARRHLLQQKQNQVPIREDAACSTNYLLKVSHAILATIFVYRYDNATSYDDTKSLAMLLRSCEPETDWSKSTQPLTTAVFLNFALWNLGSSDWTRWNKAFTPYIFKRVIVLDNHRACWSAASLGIKSEAAALGLTPDDERIYTTALILLWPRQHHILPTFIAVPQDDHPSASEWDDDDIDITF